MSVFIKSASNCFLFFCILYQGLYVDLNSQKYTKLEKIRVLALIPISGAGIEENIKIFENQNNCKIEIFENTSECILPNNLLDYDMVIGVNNMNITDDIENYFQDLAFVNFDFDIFDLPINFDIKKFIPLFFCDVVFYSNVNDRVDLHDLSQIFYDPKTSILGRLQCIYLNYIGKFKHFFNDNMNNYFLNNSYAAKSIFQEQVSDVLFYFNHHIEHNLVDTNIGLQRHGVPIIIFCGGILKNKKKKKRKLKRDLCYKFLNFLISKNMQEAIAEDLTYYPVNKDAISMRGYDDFAFLYFKYKDHADWIKNNTRHFYQ